MSKTHAEKVLEILMQDRVQKRETNGYLEIYLDGRWQFLHRYIAQEKMKGKIRPEHEVHHIDGNKRNNHPSNLSVLPKWQHQAIHKLQNEGAEFHSRDLDRALDKLDKMVAELRRRLDTDKSNSASNTVEPEDLFTDAADMFNDEIYDGEDYDKVPCSRCGGSGYLRQYDHVEDGICFQCDGSGIEML